MDLKTLDVVTKSNEGFAVQLIHPTTGDELPIFFEVLGADSEEYRKVESKQDRKRVSKVWKGSRFQAGAYTREDIESDNIRRMAAVTKKWWEVLLDGSHRGTLENDGEFLDCTIDNAVAIYTNNPWIKEQVFEAINDRGNFISG